MSDPRESTSFPGPQPSRALDVLVFVTVLLPRSPRAWLELGQADSLFKSSHSFFGWRLVGRHTRSSHTTGCPNLAAITRVTLLPSPELGSCPPLAL